MRTSGCDAFGGGSREDALIGCKCFAWTCFQFMIPAAIISFQRHSFRFPFDFHSIVRTFSVTTAQLHISTIIRVYLPMEVSPSSLTSVTALLILSLSPAVAKPFSSPPDPAAGGEESRSSPLSPPFLPPSLPPSKHVPLPLLYQPLSRLTTSLLTISPPTHSLSHPVFSASHLSHPDARYLHLHHPFFLLPSPPPFQSPFPISTLPSLPSPHAPRIPSSLSHPLHPLRHHTVH